MSPRRVVVDGSNIATEGRSTPSLAQLDAAVRAYLDENPDDEITVVVDATFAHRIDPSEVRQFEEAAAHGEVVYPPAGAIGRGDAFLLRIAEKTDAIVLSNDSFQEFHGEHDWLFTKGRLIGGTPVPGVGWIFVPRTPVRGPRSREAVKEAKRTKVRVGSKEASAPMPTPKAPPPRRSRDAAIASPVAAAGAAKASPAKAAAKKTRSRKAPAKKAVLEVAIAEATQEAELPDDAEPRGKRRRRRRKAGPLVLPTMNEPLVFLNFVAEHPKPGDEVEAMVDSFQSHGAFVLVGDARCYVPLSAMGEPPPRSAREVLTKGETRNFVIQAYDAPRRGIELALPGFVHPAGEPTEETVKVELGVDEADDADDVGEAIAPRRGGSRKQAAPAKKRTAAAKKAPAKKAPATKAPAAKAPAKKKSAATKKAPITTKSTKKAAAQAKQSTAKKPAMKKATTSGKQPRATKSAPKKTGTPKKAASSKSSSKRTAPAKSASKKAPKPVKVAATKKSASKKSPSAKRATAKRR